MDPARTINEKLQQIERFLNDSSHEVRLKSARPLGGGSSNFSYLLETDSRPLVLRHGPIGHGLAGAHDMQREYRVQAALQRTAVPVPRVLAYCDDPSPLGAPFYVMEHIAGVIPADKPPVQPLPEGFAVHHEERWAMGSALVRTMAALHSVEPDSVGLENFGRLAGYAQRQVRRWTEQWETWRTRDYPVMDEVLRRLRAALPAASEATIVHGDFRLGNLIFDKGHPGRVLGVLDWEMATLGDPIADLGYTLVYWGEPGDDSVRARSMDLASITAQPGFHTRAELVAEYARLTSRDVSTIDFWEMLARVKLAVFGERGYARFLKARQAGVDIDPLLLARGESRRDTIDQAEVALAIGDRSENPRLRGA